MKNLFGKNMYLKILIVIICVCVSLVIIQIGRTIHWINNTELKMVGKTHFDFLVKDRQVVNYVDFINPKDETEALNQISEDIRIQISNYMKKNNLKLQEGHHYFNRIDGTYEEYIYDNFKFEKIE